MQVTSLQPHLVYKGRWQVFHNMEEVYEGPVSHYKITGPCDYCDETGEKVGELEIGSVQALPDVIGDVFVEQGLAEKVDAPAEEVEVPAEAPLEEVSDEVSE
jgi:hypothetical protein